MKDDLLIRFIEGKTTPEETELVLKELSQDNEAAKEWMQMVQGARLADSKPVMNIDSDEFIAKTLAEKTGKQQAGGKTIRLPWILSAVAAAAASVAIVVTVMRGTDDRGNIPSQDMLAESTTETVIPTVEDSTVEKNIVDIQDSPVSDMGSNETKIEEVRTEQMEEIVSQKIVQDSNTATASESYAPSLEIVKPAKSPYRVRVRNPEKEFVFEWKMTDASKARLSIADKNGKVLINVDNVSEEHFGVTSSSIVDKGMLDWTLEVTFSDGSMQKKTGEIELVSVKN